nr:zwei Ig domain protein zig-8-like [Procambarus clarkii]
MVWCARSGAIGCSLTLAAIGAVVVMLSTAFNGADESQHQKIGKRSSSSMDAGPSDSIMPLGVPLSGSPEEPIRLDLSGVREEEEEVQERSQRTRFDKAAPTNVSGLTGTSAYLHCLVHNLGNRSVSWIRQRDLRIMTVGRYTYTTDQRYEVINSPGSKDWILKIKYAQVRDSGTYECQVSTKPVTSYVVRLNVFSAPQAQIIGAPDMHVDMGSTINLTCTIAHSPEPPAFIYWYHNGKVVNYDSPRGGITVVTERGNTTSGYLLIQDARASDNGNYSCVPSNTAATTLRVHVLNGEAPAAMQTNGVRSLLARPSGLLYYPLQVLCFLPLLTLVVGDVLPPIAPRGRGT